MAAPADSPPPLVSFVIPAYNARRTLPDTFASLAAQTEPRWEAVVVDDGSSDRTAAMIREFSARDPRIRLIRQANGGASSARNTGLAHARAAHVVFLDADDWIDPDYLETLLPLARDERTIAYCAYRRIMPSGRSSPPDWCPELEVKPFALLARRCEPAIHCVIAPRQLVLDVGGFDTGLRTCEDWDLWLRLARTGARFRGSPQPLAHYRMRANSLSTEDETGARTAQIVLQRALGPDPRVRCPAPEFANGWADSPERRFKTALLTELGRLAEGGLPSHRWLDEGYGREWQTDAAGDADAIASEVLHHLETNVAAARHPVIIAAFLTGIVTVDPWLGAAVADALDLVKVRDGAITECETAGRWLAVAIDPAELPPRIEKPAQCDALLLRVATHHGPERKLALPLTGPVERSHLAAALIESFSLVELVRISKAWRSPAFWKGVLSGAPETIAAALGDGSLRSVASKSVAGHLIRRGMLHKFGTSALAPAPFLGEDRSVPVFLFERMVAGQSGLLDETLGTSQLIALLELLGSEGYTPVTVNDMHMARARQSPLPEMPAGLVFSHGQSFLELGLHHLPELQGCPMDLLLTPAELARDDVRRHLPELRGAKVRIGLKAERLPIATNAAISLGKELRAEIEAINGDAGVAAMCVPEGLPDAICQAAGFAPILSPSCAQVRLANLGAIFPTIVCTGSEAIGTAIECLRPSA